MNMISQYFEITESIEKNLKLDLSKYTLITSGQDKAQAVDFMGLS